MVEFTADAIDCDTAACACAMALSMIGLRLLTSHGCSIVVVTARIGGDAGAIASRKSSVTEICATTSKVPQVLSVTALPSPHTTVCDWHLDVRKKASPSPGTHAHVATPTASLIDIGVDTLAQKVPCTRSWLASRIVSSSADSAAAPGSVAPPSKLATTKSSCAQLTQLGHPPGQPCFMHSTQ